jgi:two-component system, response regulator YesN
MAEETIRMLYVDDEPLMCRALVRALRRQPVDVLTAGTGTEGVAVAAREDVDLVITDYLLNDITGIEVATQIHALRPGAAIVLVSGFYDWAQRENELEAAGIEYFLPKPWEITQLEGIILDVLKRKQRPSDAPR